MRQDSQVSSETFVKLYGFVVYGILRGLNFEIKTEGPHTSLGAAAPCVHEIIPYNINMIIFKSTCSKRVSDDCFFFRTGNWCIFILQKKMITAPV